MLGGTVYVTGNITTENSNLDGDETVCAEGKIYLEQGLVRSNVIPIIISLKADADGIVAERECTLDGVLYAPYGSIRLENIELYGAVGGKTVTMEYCIIIYAKELHGRPDLPGGELNTVSYSYK